MRLPPFLALLTCLAAGTFAAEPEPVVVRHSLSLEAKTISSGGSSEVQTGHDVSAERPLVIAAAPSISTGQTARVSNYTKARSKASSTSLAVEVRNLSRLPDTAELQWFFVAKPLHAGSTYIFDEGSKPLNLLPGSFQKVELQSALLEAQTRSELQMQELRDSAGRTTARSTLGSSRVKEGATVGGWMVRIVAEGKLQAVRASSPALEAIARSEDQLAAFSRQP